MTARILYVAIAEARGHLMRAHILRQLCEPRGIEVEIVTSSSAGVTFLEQLGSPSELMSEHFALSYDERHNIQRGAIERETFRYLVSPRRYLADLRWLRRRAEGVDLIVNDSYHPGLLLSVLGAPILHVFGENMREAVFANFERYPRTAGRIYRSVLAVLEGHAVGRIEHTLGAGRCSSAVDTIKLPPIFPAPVAPPAEVREALGVGNAKLAVAYMNPRFRDPALAVAIEQAAAQCGFELYAVGEGYGSRDGWTAVDESLTDKLAAADVIISGAGMGVLGIQRTLEIPLLCLLGDQPEQRANLEGLSASARSSIEVCDLKAGLTSGSVAASMRRLAKLALRAPSRASARESSKRIEALHDRWADAVAFFVERATTRKPTHPRTRKKMSSETTRALVIETNNLQGGDADEEVILSSLARLFEHLREQTMPLLDLDELIVTHDGLSEARTAELAADAGLEIRFVRLPHDTNYYEAKNIGFDHTSSEVVAFADADCLPEPQWLEELLAPFEDKITQVVAGRTAYRDDVFGIAATTIDFMYFASPSGPDCTRNFYANNVAFRREVFGSRRFPTREAIYRGPCQVLGLRLQADGIAVKFVPAARTLHRFPDSKREFAALRLMRGQDAAEFTRDLGEAYLPRGLRWLSKMGPLSAAAVIGARFGYSLQALGNQDMSELRGLRRLGAMGVIAGISSLDGVGALGRSLGILDHRRGGGHAGAVLSYHSDVEAPEPAEERAA